MAKRAQIRCPTCKKPVRRADPDFPFCSPRCRTIDLGKWASGAYVISSPLNQADQTGEADYALQPRPAFRPAAAPQRDAEPPSKEPDAKPKRR